MNRCKYLLLAVCLVTIALSTGCGSIIVEEFPICTNSASQGSPAISGNIVVWRDGRNEGFESIYGYNLDTKTEFVICTVEETQKINPTIANPDVSGNIVVWQQLVEGSGYNIWGYNLETGEKFPVFTDSGSQVHPKISGNFVVWLNWVAPAVYQIQAYNLLTSTIEFSTSAGGFTEYSFDLSGKIMVWGGGTIKAKNLESGQEFSIAARGASASFLGIDGNTIIWIDYSPTSSLWREHRAGDLVAYDVIKQEEYRLPETWTKIYTPVISGDIIVWVEDIYDNPNIYGYDLGTKRGFTISDKSGYQANPAIDGNIVVWMDRSSGKGDIYGARILRGSK